MLNFDIRLLDRVPQSDLATLGSLEISISCLASASLMISPLMGLVWFSDVMLLVRLLVGFLVGLLPVGRVVGLVVTEESWLA